MNDREHPSGLETDEDTFSEAGRPHWSWNAALVTLLGLMALCLIMKIDLARVASPPVHREEAPVHRLDLNTASLAELQALPNIGPVRAQRIMDARPFDSAHDLLRVPGLGPKTMQSLLPHIKVSTDGLKSE
jgi:DNA uptake protein ComE-like DNA-binding protein